MDAEKNPYVVKEESIFNFLESIGQKSDPFSITSIGKVDKIFLPINHPAGNHVEIHIIRGNDTVDNPLVTSIYKRQIYDSFNLMFQLSERTVKEITEKSC